MHMDGCSFHEYGEAGRVAAGGLLFNINAGDLPSSLPAPACDPGKGSAPECLFTKIRLVTFGRLCLP